MNGRDTRLFINPDNVDASTLLDWFVCDNFAKRKMKWFNNCGLSINRALSTSNAIWTTIASYNYKRKRKGKHYSIVGRLIDIDVDSFTWYDACTFCGLDIQHVSERIICSNCNKEKPPTTISVSGYMTILDSTGKMRVKLFTKQIEFILYSTKAKLKHMFDAVLYDFMNFTLIDNMTKLKYNVRCNFSD
ncbi:uncharacterized protein LOC125497457 [Beta vulgaris subsp. vulgaris]|uniref:uncharacterized protein LOC125497457 n=1 Tax=Beta vulgaris subsp. vulgaris TaxID=3555 RepID=UPI0020373620|nr:uncharacterized protein LOC125497457 [Beta vulgaris subsp. vulgaris]